MGFMDNVKKFGKEIMRPNTNIHIVGGQNLLSDKQFTAYNMKETDEKGIVQINDGKKFYYLGLDQESSHSRSVGKAGAGAVIGTVLAPGIGTIIGGALGAKKKDTSTATLDFIDCETDKFFSVIIKCDDKKRKDLMLFTVSSYQPKTDSVLPAELSAADEILKFKSLLDQGIITQEEFEVKKKELLGM